MKNFLLKWYKTWNPSILIWDVEIIDEINDLTQHFYFLFKWAAYLFIDIKKEEIKDYKVSMGGVELWIW